MCAELNIARIRLAIYQPTQLFNVVDILDALDQCHDFGETEFSAEWPSGSLWPAGQWVDIPIQLCSDRRLCRRGFFQAGRDDRNINRDLGVIRPDNIDMPRP